MSSLRKGCARFAGGSECVIATDYPIVMYFYIYRIIITYSMKENLKSKEKLYRAYDTVSSRTNCYHNGGTASEKLYSEVEYTLGLDNRGGMDDTVLIKLPFALIASYFVYVASSRLMPIITDPTASIILSFAVSGTICLCILKGFGH